MNFQEILDDVKKKKALANSELPTDPRTRNVKLGHIKRAKEDLKELYIQYRNEVKTRAVFILPKGSQSSSFVDPATEEFGCFSIKAEDLYEKIANPVSSRYHDNQQSSPALFDILMSSFNDVCDDIGIIGYPAVLFESKYLKRLKTREDLVNLIKQAFNEKVGSDLVGLYAIDAVARKAFDEGFTGKAIPIIIETDDKKLTDELKNSLKNLTNNVFMVSTTKKQSMKLVEEKLTKIRESLK